MLKIGKAFLLILVSIFTFTIFAKADEKVTVKPAPVYDIKLEGVLVRKAGVYYLRLPQQDVMLPEDSSDHSGISYEGFMNKSVTLKGKGNILSTIQQRKSIYKLPNHYKIKSVSEIKVVEPPEKKEPKKEEKVDNKDKEEKK